MCGLFRGVSLCERGYEARFVGRDFEDFPDIRGHSDVLPFCWLGVRRFYRAVCAGLREVYRYGTAAFRRRVHDKGGVFRGGVAEFVRVQEYCHSRRGRQYRCIGSGNLHVHGRKGTARNDSPSRGGVPDYSPVRGPGN